MYLVELARQVRGDLELERGISDDEASIDYGKC